MYVDICGDDNNGDDDDDDDDVDVHDHDVHDFNYNDCDYIPQKMWCIYQVLGYELRPAFYHY
jgi:hypothetical protein